MSTRKCMIGVDIPSSKILNLRGDEGNLFNLRDRQAEIIQNLKSNFIGEKSSKWENKMKIMTEKQSNNTEIPLQPAGKNSNHLLNSDMSNAENSITICHNQARHQNVTPIRSLSSWSFDESKSESHVRDGFAATSETNKSLPHSIKLENCDSKLDIDESLDLDDGHIPEGPLNNTTNNSTKEPTSSVKTDKYSTQKEILSQELMNNENLKLWKSNESFTRNPITGAITHFNNNQMGKPVKVVENDDMDGVYKKSSSRFPAILDNFIYSKRPGKIIQHRNPITGEGITDDMNYYKFMPRGIRVIQPPGGTSNFPNI